MASTITIQDGLTFCSPFIGQQTMAVNNQQPGLGAAQVVLNRILGAPCVWRFNRATFSIPITTGNGTDYAVSVPALGFIEQQWLQDGTGDIYELQGSVSLARGSGPKRPTEVAPQYDDNAGNVTFRFSSVPDKPYTAFFDYQNKPPLITSIAQPLPIPDEHSDLFFTGLLAWAGMLVKDQRFPIWQNDFISLLLSRQDGLDDQAKAILVGDWMNLVRTVSRNQGAAQAGNAGRSR